MVVNHQKAAHMYTLDELIEQNKDIAQLCQILSVLMPNTDLHDNDYVIELMELFKDKVWMHLVFEDKTVYAELARHEDEDISNIAREFHQTARDTKKDFTRFMRNWQHHQKKGDKKPLCQQCETIFKQILERTEFENKKMFPLVEKHQKLD